MVGEEGLEPSRPKPHAPKACVYANFTTRPLQKTYPSLAISVVVCSVGLTVGFTYASALLAHS